MKLHTTLCKHPDISVEFSKSNATCAVCDKVKQGYESDTLPTRSLLQTKNIKAIRSFNMFLFGQKVEHVKWLASGRKMNASIPMNIKIKKVKIPILEFPGLSAPVEKPTFNAEWQTQSLTHDSNRVILFFHGSCYAILNRRSHRAISCKLGKYAHARVLSVDYRLAPEAVYPAAVIDALSAYSWLLNPPDPKMRKYSPGQISFAGDSAGGGLAIAAMLYLRDTGYLPLPSAIATLSPWLDLTQSLPAWHLNEMHDYLPASAKDPNHFSKDRRVIYTNSNAELVLPYVSPIFAKETDVPICPLLIQVGGAERPRDDGIAFASKFFTNSPIALEIYQDQAHVFHFFTATEDIAKYALRRAANFIMENTGGNFKLPFVRTSVFIRNTPGFPTESINASKMIDDGCEKLVELGRWSKNNDEYYLEEMPL